MLCDSHPLQAAVELAVELFFETDVNSVISKPDKWPLSGIQLTILSWLPQEATVVVYEGKELISTKVTWAVAFAVKIKILKLEIRANNSADSVAIKSET